MSMKDKIKYEVEVREKHIDGKRSEAHELSRQADKLYKEANTEESSLLRKKLLTYRGRCYKYKDMFTGIPWFVYVKITGSNAEGIGVEKVFRDSSGNVELTRDLFLELSDIEGNRQHGGMTRINPGVYQNAKIKIIQSMGL